MWTYIFRRLLVMIPTLFGVTVVSFLIMQAAPGDPLKNQLGTAGLASQEGGTREGYLLRKRELKLDKPLLLNFNYFRDYSAEVRHVVHYLSLTEAQLAEELAATAKADDAQARARLAFLQTLQIEDLAARLADPEQRAGLATAVRGLVEIRAEDLGVHGVPPAMAILRSDEATQAEKIGAIQALTRMVVEPLTYSYSRDPSAERSDEIVAVWRTWWERAQAADAARGAAGKEPLYPPLSQERRAALEQRFESILAAESRLEMFRRLEFFNPDQFEPFQQADMRLFVEKLLADPPLEAKVVAVTALAAYVGRPLVMSVPPDAPPERVAEVAQNWLLYYEFHADEYNLSLPRKLWYIVADTQYANIAWRLVTFDFGRSATRTREPVAQRIWAAVLVSAPIMIISQVLIYLVAVPLGVLCAVNRGKFVDRSISLGLFLLYSIPAFVAGMLFLLFLAYGSPLRLFPMNGLHSDYAQDLGPVAYFLDYLWHITLPVICLSLFSLAGMAMYSRTSMLDVIDQDYIRTARAKGLSRSTVILKHGLRNSLIPIITLFSNFLPAMLGGSVLIEAIFSIPGMGFLSWASIEQQDFPTLMAIIYIDAIVVMLSILLTDILYIFVDPRISFGGQGAAA